MWVAYRISSDLNKACVVSKGDEGDRAMDAMQCNPAAEADTISCMVKAKGATAMGAGGPLEEGERGRVCLLQVRLGDGEA